MTEKPGGPEAHTHIQGGKPLALLGKAVVEHTFISHLLFIPYLLPKGGDTAVNKKHRYERTIQPLKLMSEEGGEGLVG